jgi:Dolichyl-phosphate-mannose-protein mannosyltransferase
LALVVAAGAVLRVGYVVAVTRHDRHFYDAVYYEQEARNIADGKGLFHQPLLELQDPPVVKASAEHPPLTELLLVPAAALGNDDLNDLAMRLTMALIGTGTVAMVGLIGRDAAGPVAGLAAAGIAALDPNLWMNDGILMSEGPATLGAAVLIWLAIRAWRGATSWRWAAGLGLAAGLTTLARSELSILFPLLVVPVLVVGTRRAESGDGVDGEAIPAGRHWRRWFVPVALAGVSFGSVLAPWVLFNLSRFDTPAPLSTAVGEAMASANCDTVYYGSQLGGAGLNFYSADCVPHLDSIEVSTRDAQLRRMALSYMAHHATRVPVVAAARLGRVFYVFRPAQTIDNAHAEGRPEWAEWLGAATTWVLVPLAAVGWWTLRRQRAPLWPLVAPLLAVLASFLIVAGIPRYRAAAEPTLVVLAAAAVVRGSPERRHTSMMDEHPFVMGVSNGHDTSTAPTRWPHGA